VSQPDPKNVFSLGGKVAIVTGGAIGLGRTMAEYLAAFGANVAVVDLDEGGANKAAREIASAQGVRAIGCRCNVASVEEINAAVDRVAAELGTVDILLNNAGINVREPALEVSEDHWDRILDVNLKGMFFFAQAAGRIMAARRSGKIINMSSIQGVIAHKLRSAYASSKGGVIAMTRQLAIEWAQYNIQVNSIAPSFFVTPMNKPLFEDKEFSAFIYSHTPLGRPGEPHELGGVVVFLASAASSFVTGHTLLVDGGFTATG
jgi:NAD(P)-dependent dehydrogenase (short-subunit alcohol dehydrogenase family)